MALAHALYATLPNSEKLLSSQKTPFFDFIILPLCKFVEPDPLPWFPHFSTGNVQKYLETLNLLHMYIGKILTLMWSLFTMVIIFAYQCNLRASLVNVSYEKSIETVDDAINSDRNIYMAIQVIHTAFSGLDKEGTEITEKLRKLFEKIQQSPGNGTYDLTHHYRLPQEADADFWANGALTVLPKTSVAYFYVRNKVRGHFLVLTQTKSCQCIDTSPEKPTFEQGASEYHVLYLACSKVFNLDT